jgi:16S rRNA (cytidine1402-2'-O)-methyltransferase
LPGRLRVCATPIGNLEDITARVLRALREADLIAAEDTRRALTLLNHYGIKTPLVSHHEHNARESAARIAERIADGAVVALVTDAGMPCVSDPGFELIRAARELGADIEVCPGASALTAALAVSGIPAGRFVFDGFPPARGAERGRMFRSYLSERRAALLFEAPHRLARTLAELADTLGERRAAVCRELTKIHETVHEGTLVSLAEYFARNEPRGEIVLVIEGAGEESGPDGWSELTPAEHAALYMSRGASRGEAAKLVARDRGVPKREIYRQLLEDTDNEGE